MAAGYMMDNQDNSAVRGSALVVDDDPEMRKMLGLVLKRGGFAVELADGGEEALAKIAAGVPSIIVTDLHMPGMSGIELLAKVREQHRDLPIIVLTASGGVASAVEAMRAGAEDYLTKPIDPAALRFAVDRAIERTKQRAETDLLRKALAELRDAHAALSAERDFIATVLDTIETLVVVVDLEGRIRTWNRACERVTGFTEAEMLGEDLFERLFLPDDRASVRGSWSACIAGEFATYGYEKNGRTKDGKLRLISWTNTVLRDEAGQPKNTIASGVDVTEAREMAQRVRRTEHLASMATFAAGIAHEIRNPLNAASLHLTLLGRLIGRGEPDLEGAREAAGIAGGEIRRVHMLLEEFLMFARPQPLRRTMSDLRVLCDDVAALCRVEASASSVEIASSGDASLEAFVDEQRMRQVLLNLVRNAMEAVGPGGHVSLAATSEGGKANIVVEDDGQGLKADEVQIFQPFFTTKEKGTGLGLAITHRIVVDHGGDIGVESRPGRTVFTISLPLGETKA